MNDILHVGRTTHIWQNQNRATNTQPYNPPSLQRLTTGNLRKENLCAQSFIETGWKAFGMPIKIKLSDLTESLNWNLSMLLIVFLLKYLWRRAFKVQYTIIQFIHDYIVGVKLSPYLYGHSSAAKKFLKALYFHIICLLVIHTKLSHVHMWVITISLITTTLLYCCIVCVFYSFEASIAQILNLYQIVRFCHFLILQVVTAILKVIHGELNLLCRTVLTGKASMA